MSSVATECLVLGPDQRSPIADKARVLALRDLHQCLSTVVRNHAQETLRLPYSDFERVTSLTKRVSEVVRKNREKFGDFVETVEILEEATPPDDDTPNVPCTGTSYLFPDFLDSDVHHTADESTDIGANRSSTSTVACNAGDEEEVCVQLQLIDLAHYLKVCSTFERAALEKKKNSKTARRKEPRARAKKHTKDEDIVALSQPLTAPEPNSAFEEHDLLSRSLTPKAIAKRSTLHKAKPWTSLVTLDNQSGPVIFGRGKSQSSNLPSKQQKFDATLATSSIARFDCLPHKNPTFVDSDADTQTPPDSTQRSSPRSLPDRHFPQTRASHHISPKREYRSPRSPALVHSPLSFAPATPSPTKTTMSTNQRTPVARQNQGQSAPRPRVTQPQQQQQPGRAPPPRKKMPPVTSFIDDQADEASEDEEQRLYEREHGSSKQQVARHPTTGSKSLPSSKGAFSGNFMQPSRNNAARAPAPPKTAPVSQGKQRQTQRSNDADGHHENLPHRSERQRPSRREERDEDAINTEDEDEERNLFQLDEGSESEDSAQSADDEETLQNSMPKIISRLRRAPQNELYTEEEDEEEDQEAGENEYDSTDSFINDEASPEPKRKRSQSNSKGRKEMRQRRDSQHRTERADPRAASKQRDPPQQLEKRTPNAPRPAKHVEEDEAFENADTQLDTYRDYDDPNNAQEWNECDPPELVVSQTSADMGEQRQDTVYESDENADNENGDTQASLSTTRKRKGASVRNKKDNPRSSDDARPRKAARRKENKNNRASTDNEGQQTSRPERIGLISSNTLPTHERLTAKQIDETLDKLSDTMPVNVTDAALRKYIDERHELLALYFITRSACGGDDNMNHPASSVRDQSRESYEDIIAPARKMIDMVSSSMISGDITATIDGEEVYFDAMAVQAVLAKIEGACSVMWSRVSIGSSTDQSDKGASTDATKAEYTCGLTGMSLQAKNTVKFTLTSSTKLAEFLEPTRTNVLKVTGASTMLYAYQNQAVRAKLGVPRNVDAAVYVHENLAPLVHWIAVLSLIEPRFENIVYSTMCKIDDPNASVRDAIDIAVNKLTSSAVGRCIFSNQYARAFCALMAIYTSGKASDVENRFVRSLKKAKNADKAF